MKARAAAAMPNGKGNPVSVAGASSAAGAGAEAGTASFCCWTVAGVAAEGAALILTVACGTCLAVAGREIFTVSSLGAAEISPGFAGASGVAEIAAEAAGAAVTGADGF